MPSILYYLCDEKLSLESKILFLADAFQERTGKYPNICKIHLEEFNKSFNSPENKINGITVVASQYISTKNHYQLGVENDSR